MDPILENPKLLALNNIPNFVAIWEKYLHEGEKITKPKGYVLFDSKSTLKKLYYLEKGEIIYVHTYANGKQRLIAKNVAPCLVGEPTVFIPNSHSTTPIILNTDCVLYAFSVEWVQEKMIPHYHELTSLVLQDLSMKLIKMTDQKIFLNADELQVLICKLLSEKLIYKNDKIYSVTNLNQVELANFLGAHKVSVNKIIRKLQNDNIIGQYNKNHTAIFDLEKLNSIIENMSEH